MIALAGLALASGACGGSSISPAASASNPSGASFHLSPSAPTQAPGSPSLAPAAAPPSAASTAAAIGSGTGSVAIDPTLLEVLPTTVSGLPVAAIARPAGADDPLLAETVDRMAQAFVIDPATNDFAYSSVIALRPGVYDASYFRSWRDSFDEGACSQSGGVTGHAESTIAGRAVFIGRCDGGVSTYHVRLDERNEIVSISAFGEQRLGELILAGLRP
jgi:hypothetical protein